VLLKTKVLLVCHAIRTDESLLAHNAGACRPEVLGRFTGKSVAVFRSDISEDLNFLVVKTENHLGGRV